MKRILIVTVLIIAAAYLTLGQTSGQKTSQSGNTEQALRQLVSELDKAQQEHDLATLDHIWADDLSFTNPAGEVLTKAQRLASRKSGETKSESFRSDDVEVRLYGETAVVTSRATVQGQRQGQDISGQFRLTSVYVQRQGRWQLVAGQATRIARP